VIDPVGWWHSHNVRLRLTVWYVVAMVAVLAVYAAAVYAFVSRSVSESLDERLRADFFWAAATVDDSPEGLIMSTPQVDLLLEEEPWVQVLSADGREMLLNNAEARRRPIPGTEALAARGQDQIVAFDVDGTPMRASRRSYIGQRPVTVQVGRSESRCGTSCGSSCWCSCSGCPWRWRGGAGRLYPARRALAPIDDRSGALDHRGAAVGSTAGDASRR
jgi:hypothetical protein